MDPTGGFCLAASMREGDRGPDWAGRRGFGPVDWADREKKRKREREKCLDWAEKIGERKNILHF